MMFEFIMQMNQQDEDFGWGLLTALICGAVWLVWKVITGSIKLIKETCEEFVKDIKEWRKGW